MSDGRQRASVDAFLLNTIIKPVLIGCPQARLGCRFHESVHSVQVIIAAVC